MTPTDTLDAVDILASSCPPEDVAVIVGRLEVAKARALARLSRPEPRHELDALITPEQACALARIEPDRAGVRRIYAWARHQKWAVRLSPRCLRVRRDGFSKWLAAR